MWKEMRPAFRWMILFTVLTGILYPGLITVLCQVFFPRAANGSMITVRGSVIGSALIGQNFTRPEYFHPRPSAAGGGFDASASGGSNLGPASKKLIDRAAGSISEFQRTDPDFAGPIPADLVTASASGLDPDISPASAEAQAARVAKARGITLEQVQQLITGHTEPQQFGFLGEPRVNVLKINLALDRQFPANS